MNNFFVIFTILFVTNIPAQEQRPTVYLLPGQGADYRLFSKMKLGNYPYRHIVYSVPEKGSTMREYAQELSKQINTSEPFILIGTSIGGMLASEMNEFLHPEKVIIISSAQNNNQLPGRYNFQKKVPIHRLVSKGLAKRGALILQPIVEPDRNTEKETFVSMLKAKDKRYLKRAIDMIIEWEKESFDESIIHIHGNIDKTIPIKNIKPQYIIEDGSHMITLTRANEINAILKKELDLQ